MNSGELIKQLQRTGEEHEVYMMTGTALGGYAKFSGFVNTRLKNEGNDEAQPAIILMSEQEMAKVTADALETFGGLIYANPTLYENFKANLEVSLMYHFGISGKDMAESVIEELFATSYSQIGKKALPSE